MAESDVTQHGDPKFAWKERPRPPAPRHRPPNDLDAGGIEQILRGTHQAGVAVDPGAVEGPEHLNLDVGEPRPVEVRAKRGNDFPRLPGPRNADVEERLGQMRKAERDGARSGVPATKPADIHA